MPYFGRFPGFCFLLRSIVFNYFLGSFAWIYCFLIFRYPPEWSPLRVTLRAKGLAGALDIQFSKIARRLPVRVGLIPVISIRECKPPRAGLEAWASLRCCVHDADKLWAAGHHANCSRRHASQDCLCFARRFLSTGSGRRKLVSSSLRTAAAKSIRPRQIEHAQCAGDVKSLLLRHRDAPAIVHQ